MIRRILTYALFLLHAPIRWTAYSLAGLVPRSPRIWVFGSWDGLRFADNTKWLFLYCLEQGYSRRCIWISRRREIVRQVRELGGEAYLAISPRGLWFSLRARYYFLDHSTQDVSHVVSNGAIRVLLFHGVPLKKLRRDVETKRNFNYRAFRGSWIERWIVRVSRPYVCETYNLITATSPAVATLYGSAFGASDHEVVVTGYPRNDSILGERLALTGRDREAYEHFASMKDQGKKIVLYLPTWRDHQRSSRPVTDWRRLGEFLARWNAVFVRKLHSYSVGSKGSEEAGGEILSIDPGADIYPLLRLADVLVTDYSSVAFDFMLLERPIVYYCYDLEEYLAAARSLYFDYHKVTPGDKARTFDELMSALQRALEGPEYMRKWENLYATTVALCHTYRDSHAARRVYEEVLRRYGE